MRQVLFWSLVASLAGLLFGFDTVVISGADKKLQNLWQSSDAFHGTVVMAMALWGTVVGALFGAYPTQRYGRKKILLWVGLFYTVSAVGSALSNDPITFAVFRFIGGLGVGVSGIAVPAYISEIAPAKSRGRLVGVYQARLVFGILLAFFSNYILSDTGENDWRWMMGVEAFPAAIYTLLCFLIPKSPRWLISKGFFEEAKAIHNRIDPKVSFENLVEEINKSTNIQNTDESIFENLRINIPVETHPIFVLEQKGYPPQHLQANYAYSWNTSLLHRAYCTEKTEAPLYRTHIMLGFSCWWDFDEATETWTQNEFFGKKHPWDMLNDGEVIPGLKLV